jgi:hypothetical protein
MGSLQNKTGNRLNNSKKARRLRGKKHAPQTSEPHPGNNGCGVGPLLKLFFLACLPVPVEAIKKSA